MKLRLLMATAAVGLVISGVAIAAETNHSATAPAAAQAANSNTASAAPSSLSAPSSTTTTTASTTTTQTQTQGTKTILDLASNNSEFSTLTKAVKAAGLEQTLSGKGPITVFAPTNAAFAKLGTEKLNNLLKPENKAQLTQILTYHVVPSALPAQSSAQPTSIATAEGQSISLTRETNGLQVQNAKSQGQPISASNGSIIAIDSVLTPGAADKMGTNSSAAMAPTTSPANAPALAPNSSNSTSTTTTTNTNSTK